MENTPQKYPSMDTHALSGLSRVGRVMVIVDQHPFIQLDLTLDPFRSAD
jgi:hypothetical protein